MSSTPPEPDAKSSGAEVRRACRLPVRGVGFIGPLLRAYGGCAVTFDAMTLMLCPFLICAFSRPSWRAVVSTAVRRRRPKPSLSILTVSPALKPWGGVRLWAAQEVPSLRSSRHAVVVALDDETPATSCHLESEVSFASEDEGLFLGGGARSVVDM